MTKPISIDVTSLESLEHDLAVLDHDHCLC